MKTERPPCHDNKIEWLKSRQSALYFVTTYVHISHTYAPAAASADTPAHALGSVGWIPFELWPRQAAVLEQMTRARRLVILKARQLGITWLCLAYALWLLVFYAPATILLFSLREAEAKELLNRLRGMYRRLPVWMQARALLQDSGTMLELSTGARALAFSTRSGRSYTGTLALVDEADFIPELNQFLNGVKPTIDAGGQLFLVSTSDKTRPVSTFKNLFRAAHPSPTLLGSGRENPTRGQGAPIFESGSGAGAGDYEAVFLPWSARPGRDEAWHARTKAEMFAQRGADDDFFAEYPATVQEALAPEQLDRRLPLAWVMNCLTASTALTQSREGAEAQGPALPGLTIYEEPEVGKWYVIGADPAEGNPNSDDSAATVLDGESWAEVACLVGKFEPSTFASYLAELAVYYHDAGVLVERNNHGHSVLLALAADARSAILNGYDGKPGWLNNVKGKPMMYSFTADALRDGACVVRSSETANQLASIQASDLRAPSGLADDRAVSFALAISALALDRGAGGPGVAIAPRDPLAGVDEDGW
jgi:hypothetical protein